MHIIAEPNCQVIKLVAIFDIGRHCESKRGLASSVANMMKKATKAKSNQILQEYIDRYALNIDIYSSPLYFTCELHCHKNFIYQAVSIFFEILFEANFTAEIWDIVRNQTKESILQQENQTDFWADKILSEHVFGENHPLGYYSQSSDYDSIDLENINSFYSQFIQKRLPVLFLAGDINTSIEDLILDKLATYTLSRTKIEFELNYTNVSTQILKKKLEDSSQASIRLGKLIPRRNFEEFIELELYNTMLGGYYTSQLMQELRIKNGYTYGAYSYFIHFPEFSFFQIGFESDSQVIKPSILAIKNLFLRLKLDDNAGLTEARKQYYSQWSKNAERSLQEIMYQIKMYKLGYNYEDYSTIVNQYEAPLPFNFSRFNEEIYNFESYNQALVY